MTKLSKFLLCGSILSVAFLVAAFFMPTAMAADEIAVPTLYADDTTNKDGNIAIDEIRLIKTEAKALGVEVPGTFYFLKQLRYSVQKAFTFNPVKKAEIELQQASEQLVRIRTMAYSSDNPVIQEKIQATLIKYEDKIEQIKDRADEFRTKAPELADKFMEKLTDRQIKQQEIMYKLEEKMPEEALQNLNQVREKTMEHYGEVVGKIIENKEAIAEHIIDVMETQNSTDFNRLKHIEILKELEDKVPTEAKAAIIEAEKNVLDKFTVEINEMPEELKELQFHSFIERARTDSNTRLEVLEEVKSKNIMSPDIASSFNLIKEEYNLNTEAIKKGIEDLSQSEKQLLQQTREKAQKYIDDKSDRQEQLQIRLENNYTNMSETQKQDVEHYIEKSQEFIGIKSKDQEEYQEKTREQVREKIMNKEQAKQTATNSICAQQGKIKDNVLYNENSKTWWVDLEIDKPGCNPACVIHEDTGATEINWRCTGVIPPNSNNEIDDSKAVEIDRTTPSSTSDNNKQNTVENNNN